MNVVFVRNIFFVFLVFQILLPVEAIYKLPLQINTPLKAAILYFPSPSVMRCLNHSNIPRTFRKGIVTRKIEIPHEGTLQETVTIGINSISKHKKRFILRGNIKSEKEIFTIKFKSYPFFNYSEQGEKIPAFFGFEDLLGLQRRIHLKDKIGNQNLDYEVFLKTTRGKIGKLKYELNLFGQDKSIEGMAVYFLDGKGKIGKYPITVTGKELQKDYYEINEKYGPVKVLTTVKVYD